MNSRFEREMSALSRLNCNTLRFANRFKPITLPLLLASGTQAARQLEKVFKPHSIFRADCLHQRIEICCKDEELLCKSAVTLHLYSCYTVESLQFTLD